MGEWGCFFPTSVCQWGHRMEQEFTEIDWHGLSIVIYCCTLGDEGRRAEKKKWSEKHLAVTLGTPCPLMSVMRTSIIWLSLFHRSLVIALHVGTSSVVLSPRGCSDYGWLDSCVGSWYIHPDAHTDKQILKMIGQVRHSNMLCPSPQLHSSKLHRWKIDAVSHFPQLQSCFIQIWQIELRDCVTFSSQLHNCPSLPSPNCTAPSVEDKTVRLCPLWQISTLPQPFVADNLRDYLPPPQPQRFSIQI